MSLWQKIKDSFTPEPFDYKEGWYLKDDKPVYWLFCQRPKNHYPYDRNNNAIPPKGSDYWSDGTHFAVHEKDIFDSKEEAIQGAIRKTDERIDSLVEQKAELFKMLTEERKENNAV